MRDTDGDGHADVREVVFSGFGTGDMHQAINSFTWTPDGALMFSQGLHTYSNITTAYGGRRLYGAGFWMYRPLSGKLTPYPTGFPLNAWGTVYDDNGQPFSVAGAAGMFWTTPLLISTDHLIEGRALPNNGQIVKQGMLKYCGIDIPRNAHWPKEMHGELVSGGFFENCIYRHKLQTDSANPSGYEAVRQPDLLKSSSVSFRPVDVKFGPQGDLYISDWYNPIIGHYQASFRHPDRDKTHGRIWRLVKKGTPLEERKDVAAASPAKLFHLLALGNRWEQYQAQRLLMGTGPAEVLKGYTAWNDTGAGIANLTWNVLALPLRQDQWFETVDDEFLTMESNCGISTMETYAVRCTGLWSDHLRDPLSIPAKSIADESPRVRLEAIAACAHIPKPESIAVALRALDYGSAGGPPVQNPSVKNTGGTPALPLDSFLDRSLELAIYALAPQWEPALQEGKLKLPPKHLAYLLEKKNSPEMLSSIRAMLNTSGTGSLPVGGTGSLPVSSLDTDSRRVLLLLLANQGTTDDIALALSEGARDPALLNQLADLAESQSIKAPANATEVLTAHPNAKLIGLWKLTTLTPKLKTLLDSPEATPDTKRGALIALARLDAEHDLTLKLAADPQQPWLVRLGAVEALCERHVVEAATTALALMPAAKTEDNMRALLAPFLARAPRTKALTAALTATPCDKESADLATRALIGIGRNEPGLTTLFNHILGRTAPVQPYDMQWVSSLANEATVSGNAKRGNEIFHRVTLNCIACHSIGGQGGIIGPQLDAVGRGVPTELLVEAVMWPQRQIKEGFVATTVVMKDGRTLAGYKVAENGKDLQIRDMATQQVTALPKSAIQTRADAGSLMPEGLTASLSREELRDLIAYLASLGK
jgi:putative heme-binding domain-containing protein